jgi:hypothetical protein
MTIKHISRKDSKKEATKNAIKNTVMLLEGWGGMYSEDSNGKIEDDGTFLLCEFDKDGVTLETHEDLQGKVVESWFDINSEGADLPPEYVAKINKLFNTTYSASQDFGYNREFKSHEIGGGFSMFTYLDEYDNLNVWVGRDTIGNHNRVSIKVSTDIDADMKVTKK